jgi:hypothetical protein
LSQNVKDDGPLVHTLGTTTSLSSHVFENVLVVVRVKRGFCHWFHTESFAFIRVLEEQPVSIHDQVELAFFCLTEDRSYTVINSQRKVIHVFNSFLCQHSDCATLLRSRQVPNSVGQIRLLTYVFGTLKKKSSLCTLANGRESRG